MERLRMRSVGVVRVGRAVQSMRVAAVKTQRAQVRSAAIPASILCDRASEIQAPTAASALH